jgi:hypothetical protein
MSSHIECGIASGQSRAQVFTDFLPALYELPTFHGAVKFRFVVQMPDLFASRRYVFDANAEPDLVFTVERPLL